MSLRVFFPDCIQFWWLSYIRSFIRLKSKSSGQLTSTRNPAFIGWKLIELIGHVFTLGVVESHIYPSDVWCMSNKIANYRSIVCVLHGQWPKVIFVHPPQFVLPSRLSPAQVSNSLILVNFRGYVSIYNLLVNYVSLSVKCYVCQLLGLFNFYHNVPLYGMRVGGLVS